MRLCAVDPRANGTVLRVIRGKYRERAGKRAALRRAEEKLRCFLFFFIFLEKIAGKKSQGSPSDTPRMFGVDRTGLDACEVATAPDAGDCSCFHILL